MSPRNAFRAALVGVLVLSGCSSRSGQPGGGQPDGASGPASGDPGGGSTPGASCAGSGCSTASDGDPPVVTQPICAQAFAEDPSCAASAAAGRTFYVSSSLGADSNDGLSEGAPLATLAAASALALGPGDRVLFRCGDVWRAESLILKRSGAACAHIVYGSYPAACAEPPRFSGSQPITGWTSTGGGVWVADLSAGANSGEFPRGVNQLFRAGKRLPLGRWPNPDDPAFSHGYSFIDRQPSSTVIEDDALPPGDWTGAVVRAQTIRWLLLNRRVVASAPHQLTLNAGLDCAGGCGADPGDASAHGWGYVITNHRATLDQEGEWFHDASSNKVYLVAAAEPTDVEGTVVPAEVQDLDDFRPRGIIVLGEDLGKEVNHAVVENLIVERAFQHGITTPVNLETTDSSDLVLRCNTVRDVDGIAINLATWVWNAGAESGWRGGHDQIVAYNLIEGANHKGILSYAYRTTFEGNTLRNIGVAANLGRSGLGCSFDDDNCTENGDAMHFPVASEAPTFCSHDNVVRRNVIERTGYCGMDVFGSSFTMEENVIREACFTKGDCGGIRVFGQDSLASTLAHDVTIRGNVVTDVIGNTDAANTAYQDRFGFGLYIDSSSRDVLSEGNTLARTTAAGLLYQDSTGAARGNVVYGAASREAVSLVGSTTRLSEFTGNTLVATNADAILLSADSASALPLTDGNYFIDPYQAACLRIGVAMTLASWQSSSGQDAASRGAWFTLDASAAPITELFTNATAAPVPVDLQGTYVDLDRRTAGASITLPAFSSKVLVRQ